MANESHLKEFRKGVVSWNKWMRENEDISPDLSEQDFSNEILDGADFTECNLRKCNFDHSQLRRASFRFARLENATLRLAQLEGAHFEEALLQGTNFTQANLANAQFHMAYVEERNSLREEDPELLSNLGQEDLCLDGTNLSYANLKGAQLHDLRFDGATLTGADLRDTNIADVSFIETKMQGAILNEVHLSDSRMRGADLSEAILAGAFLEEVRLQNAKLASADLRNANLRYANLNNADLANANISDADLREADLTGASLKSTVFERSDLRGCVGQIYDESLIRDARFSAPSNDPWSRLRRKYTGPRFFLHLLLVLFFFGPLFVEGFLWLSVNRIQSEIAEVQSQMESTRDTLLEEGATKTAEGLNEIIQTGGLSECLARICSDPIPIWQLLLGFNEGYLAIFLTLALVFYNIGRGILTYRISLLRDEEERSGYTPDANKTRKITVLNRKHSDWIWKRFQEHKRLASWISSRTTDVGLNVEIPTLNYLHLYAFDRFVLNPFLSLALLALVYRAINVLVFTTVVLPA